MALLEYDIRVVGAKNVDAALSNIERRFATHNARMARTFGGSTRATKGGIGSEVAQAERATVASANRVASAERRLQEQAERRKVAMQNRYFSQQQRMQERNERQAVSAAKRKEQQALSALRKEASARAQFVQSTIGRSADRVFGTVRAVGTAGAAMLGIGGAALGAAAIGQATRMDDSVRRMIINARGPGQASAYEPEKLRGQLTRTAIETGTSPEALAAAGQTFVAKTGDIKTAVENMKTFATVAQATGANVEDVASAAADLSQKFDINKPKEMADALSVLVFQGKKGAFELRDMAETFPEMAAAAQRAGLTGVAGMKTLGGLAQIARQSTGSGAEASTAAQMMLTQLTNKSGELASGEALGGKRVSVFSDANKTKARDVPEVLAEIISKSGGNREQMSKLFDVRGIRAISPMLDVFSKASTAAGGGKKGEAAGKDAILKFIKDASESGGTFKDVQRDAADTMKSFDSQMEVINTELKDVVASEIFPELIRLAPHLQELVPLVATATRVFADLVRFFASHPFVGLGAVVAAQIVMELAKAKIGSAIGNAVKAMSSGGGGFGSLVPKFGGTGFSKSSGASASGNMQAAGMGAMIGLTVATMIVTSALVKFENAQVEMQQAGKRTLDIESMGVEDIDKARQLVNEQRKEVNKLKPDSGVFGLAEKGWDWATGGNNAENQRTQEGMLERDEAHLRKLEALQTVIDALAKAGTSQEAAAEKIAEAAKKLGLPPPNRGDGPSSPVKT